MRKYLSCKGFTLIELGLVMFIISVLTLVVIGRFSDATATANTAKIASDLSSIDSAIVMYQAEGHSLTGATIEDLVNDGYLVTEPKTPAGYYFMSGSKSDEFLNKGNRYSINTNTGRAYLNKLNNTSEKFYY